MTDCIKGEGSSLAEDRSDVRVDALSNSGKKPHPLKGRRLATETVAKISATIRRKRGNSLRSTFEPISSFVPDDFDETGF